MSATLTDDGRPKEVRILLSGDACVGKTSLINTLVNGTFLECSPRRTPDTTVTVEFENVIIHIWDHNISDEAFLRNRVENSDVICVIYQPKDTYSLTRVEDYWLQSIRQCLNSDQTLRVPIILVANKIDLYKDVHMHIDRVSSMKRKYDQIQAFVQTSALRLETVHQLFQCALEVAVYPLAPIYYTGARSLTEDCRNALAQIFDLCDVDRDGLLNDQELNKFQEDVFGVPLLRDALDELKSIIRQSIREGIVGNSVTLRGFLFLHFLSVDKGRHDFTWQVLRHYGYDLRFVDKLPGSVDTARLSKLPNRRFSDRKHQKVSEGSDLPLIDLRWLRDPFHIGVGLSLATLISLVALRVYLYSKS